MDDIENQKAPKLLGLVAKIIDCSLVYSLGQLSALFVPGYIEPLHYLIGIVLLPFIAIPYETLSLYTFQTTLGRGIFGMTVNEEGKEQLSFKGALRASLFFLKRSKKLSYALTKKGKSKAIAFIATLALALGLTAGQVAIPRYRTAPCIPKATEGWVHFVSNKGQFGVDFPTSPKLEEKRLFISEANRSLDLSHFTSKTSDEVSYTVSYVKLPRTWGLAGSTKILTIAMDELYGKNEKVSVEKREFTKHWNKTPALDFEVKEGDAKYVGRLIVSGNRLFRVVMSFPKSEETAAAVSKTFIDSFNLNA